MSLAWVGVVCLTNILGNIIADTVNQVNFLSKNFSHFGNGE